MTSEIHPHLLIFVSLLSSRSGLYYQSAISGSLVADLSEWLDKRYVPDTQNHFTEPPNRKLNSEDDFFLFPSMCYLISTGRGKRSYLSQMPATYY